MFTKILSAIVMIAVVGTGSIVPAAVSRGGDDNGEKVRDEIRKLGTGPDAQVKLELRDKTKVEGYVSEANDADFIVVDPRSGTSTTVAYPQVRKARGNNLSGGVKIALTVAVIAAVTFLTYKYGRRNRRYGF